MSILTRNAPSIATMFFSWKFWIKFIFYNYFLYHETMGHMRMYKHPHHPDVINLYASERQFSFFRKKIVNIFLIISY
jgi:hypothetical protein